MDNKILIDKIADGYIPKVFELAEILKGHNDAYLYLKANEVCKKNFGENIYIRAIVEFSNYCRRRCKYCGLNANNKTADRYRMSVDEIVQSVKEAYDAGYKTIVLQSGEDVYYSKDKICEMIDKIREYCDIVITLSIGERPYEELKAFKERGANRFLLKHETSDEKLYEYLHPCGTLDARVNCLKNIKALGYETGSGFMIGLPTQTLEIVARDIMLLHELSCDMAGIGPFISHPETELVGASSGDTELTKRAVALTRLILPKSNLPATTSLGMVKDKAKDDIFSCGANVIMKKATPWKYREKYEIYPTNFGEVHTIKEDRLTLEAHIRALGKIPC